MLIQFTVGNYKTFKDPVTLSLVASPDTEMEESNVFTFTEKNIKHRLLKSAAIYGANASGKTKLIDALAFMRWFVINSSTKTQIGDTINTDPFRLNTESENEPSEFEVIFVHEKVQYRYGFEVSTEKVVAEWLYYKTNKREMELFYRDEDGIENPKRGYRIGNKLIKDKVVRDNVLLLSRAGQDNDKHSSQVILWFQKVMPIAGTSLKILHTARDLESPAKKARIIELLKAADFGIEELKAKQMDLDNLPDDMPDELKSFIQEKAKEENVVIHEDINTFRSKLSPDGNFAGKVVFSMDDDESEGTKKFFALSGPILEALENGRTVFVDEMDARLHFNLLVMLIRLFHSKVNKKNAQLIFNTHQAHLLNEELFRRDQVYIVEKNKRGEANLYSLAQFKGVRKDDNYEKRYLLGLYGGVPYLGDFEDLLED